MYKISITKTRLLNDEEKKSMEEWQKQRQWDRGQAAPFSLDAYGNIDQKHLDTVLTDEEFEKVRHAIIGLV